LKEAGEVSPEVSEGGFHCTTWASVAVEQEPSLDRGKEGRRQPGRVDLERDA
jgi:hypothetical protein